MNLSYSLYPVIGIVGFLILAFLGEFIADVINQLRKPKSDSELASDD